MTETPPPMHPVAAPLSDSDARMWSTLIHVGGIVLYFISPLVGYLVLKDRSAFVRDSSRNALNFQIGVGIALVVAWFLTGVTFGILFLLPLAVHVLNIVFSIIGAVAASRGEVYRYPLTFAFIK